VLLSNINYIVKDISYFSLYKVKYQTINKELILNLNLLVLKYKGDVIYKRIKVLKLNYKSVAMSFKR
jgi:N6-adenosine-specific RNA methylase IME4